MLCRCSTLTLPDLSTIMWSLARLQLQPHAELFTELSQHALHLLRESPGDATSFSNLIAALAQLQDRSPGQAGPDRAWLEEVEQASLQILPSAGLPELVNLAKGVLQLDHGPPSKTWQAAVLREVRLRCRRNGIELDCCHLVELLAELGIEGLAEGAALANQSFWEEENAERAYCSVQFQPGCR